MAATIVAIRESGLDQWVAAEVGRLEEKAAQHHPKSPFRPLHALRAAILRGEFEPAVADLKRLCRDNPDLYARHPGFFSQALASFAWALDLAPMAAWVTANRLGGRPLSLSISDGPSPLRGVIDVTFTPDRTLACQFSSATFRHVTTWNTIMRWLAVLPLFERYLVSPDYEPGTIPLNSGDGGQVPGLAFCSYRPDSYLIPDAVFMRENAYHSVKEHFLANPVPWRERQPMAFWRGASTGRRRPGTPWQDIPRARLCFLGSTPEAAGLIDAGISKIGQVSAEDADGMREAGILRDFVPVTAFNQYRYNIDIDGNSNSWPGLFQKLCSGSTVVKVASPFGYRQWYYDRLRPWLHFVPVAADMADLVEKVQWLRAHDDHAAAIAARGQELALSISCESEAEPAAAVIAQGIRHLDGRPDVHLTFGESGTAHPFMRGGWRHDEADRTWCHGPVSELALPAPTSLADWNLELEVDAYLQPDNKVQRLAVFGNGLPLGQFTVADGGVAPIACELLAEIVGRSPVLTLTFMHPDGEPPARFVTDGGIEPLSVAFRQVRLSRSFSRRPQSRS